MKVRRLGRPPRGRILLRASSPYDDLLELVPDGATPGTTPSGVVEWGRVCIGRRENGVKASRMGPFVLKETLLHNVSISLLCRTPPLVEFHCSLSITGANGKLAGASGTSTRTGGERFLS